jgi:hypothetical protein
VRVPSSKALYALFILAVSTGKFCAVAVKNETRNSDEKKINRFIVIEKLIKFINIRTYIYFYAIFAIPVKKSKNSFF